MLAHIPAWWEAGMSIILWTAPEMDAFLNKDIESWLAAHVVEHYDEHAIPG
jgi:ABC-type Zn2+ transport system substrate-binding protein/surface adhesin